MNSPLFAQSTGKVVYQMSSSSNGIELKWYSQDFIYPNGVNIYRKNAENGAWTKLNSKPIKKKSKVPTTTNEDLKMAYEVGSSTAAGKLTGVVLLNLILESFRTTEFADFMGIYYKDESISAGNSYWYKVTLEGSKKEIALSKKIIVGKRVSWTPQNIEHKHKRKQIQFKWKTSENLFYGVNIYRSTNNGAFEKVNDFPVIISESEKGQRPDYFYIDEYLKEKSTYKYHLKGINYFGVESKPSAGISIKVKDRTPPLAPLSLIKKDVKKLNVELTWLNNTYKEAKGINVYRSFKLDTLFQKVNKTLLPLTADEFTDVVPKPDGYYYKIATIDSSGNENFSNTITFMVEDVIPPPIPSNVKVEVDTGKIQLTWDAVDAGDLMGYRIYRTTDPGNIQKKYVLVNAHPMDSTTYTDPNLNKKNKNIFYYCVVAVDSSYNMSGFSERVEGKMPDVVPPLRPYIQLIQFEKNLLQVQWTSNTDSDLNYYELYKRVQSSKEQTTAAIDSYKKVNVKPISASAISYKDRDIELGQTYQYILFAFDSTGNKSVASKAYTIRTKPAKLTNNCTIELSLKYKNKNKNVRLDWSLEGSGCKASIDQIALFKQLKHSAPEKVLSTKSDGITTYTDKNVSIGTKYQIRAYGTNGEILYSEKVILK